MFNFNKQQQQDPQKSLNNVRNVVNTGLMGGLTKAFLGQNFVNQMNAAMDQGQAAINDVNNMNWIAQNGHTAKAEVLSVTDTGTTINMNPVLELALTVIPAVGGAFDTTTRTMVSRIAVPRKGDRINIKYNPADPSQIYVMG